jgi:hypothetical protein
LRLDDERSWIILSEANTFAWPGPDLRPAAGTGRVAYGLLPAKLFREVRARLVARIKTRRLRQVPRRE